MTRKILSVAVGMFWACAGCATGPFGYLRVDTITLHPAPPAEVRATPGAGDVVVRVDVRDLRPAPRGFSDDWNRAMVGHASNPFGEPIAPTILVREPIEQTVKATIERELGARGFRTGDGAQRVILVDIRDFYGRFNAPVYELVLEDAAARFSIDVTVDSADGRRLYARRIESTGERTRSLMPGGSELEVALDRALDAGIDTLVRDADFTLALIARSPR